MRLTASQIDKFRRFVLRKLKRCEQVYPKFVAAGKLSQGEANEDLTTLQEMQNYFNWLQIHAEPEQQKIWSNN